MITTTALSKFIIVSMECGPFLLKTYIKKKKSVVVR